MNKESSVGRVLTVGGIGLAGTMEAPTAMKQVMAENDATINYPDQVARASVARGEEVPVVNPPAPPKAPKAPKMPGAPKPPKVGVVKTAAREKNDRSSSSVIPGVMAGGAAALYLGNALRHGGFATPNKQIVEGLKDLKIPTKNPWLRTGSQILKKTHNVIRPTQEAFESFEIAHKLNNGIPINTKLPKEEQKALYDQFMKHRTDADAFSMERERIFREANNFAERDKLTNPQKKALNDFITEEFREAYPKPPKGAPYEAPFGGINPGVKVKKTTFKDMDSEIIKGLGMGGGMAASSLLVHALGDKYFEDKDNDELRKLVRQSYDVTENRKHNRDYRTPSERHKQMNRRDDRGGRRDNRHDNRGERRDNRSFNKEASYAEPEFLKRFKEVNEAIQATAGAKMNRLKEMKATGELKETAIREGMDVVVKPAIDSLLIAGVPAAIIASTGRDIRHDMSPTNGANSQQVVLDIPINEIGKQAFIGDEVMGHGRGLGKVIGELPPDDVIQKVIPELPPGFEKFDPKKFWADRGKAAVRSIPWVMTPSIAAYALGRDLRTYGSGQTQVAPPAPGYARVVIQTPTASDNADFSKMAAEAPEKKTFNDIFSENVEWIQKLLGIKKSTDIPNAKRRLMSMDMHDRERNVDPQNPMEGMQDTPV